MSLALKDSPPGFDPANVVDTFSDGNYDDGTDYAETEQL
jgi:DNA-directed RNA polymerase subunit alpha